MTEVPLFLGGEYRQKEGFINGFAALQANPD